MEMGIAEPFSAIWLCLGLHMCLIVNILIRITESVPCIRNATL